MLGQLLGAARFGMDLGLARVATALERLGDPHARVGRVAHIGGTNGKGSTAAMLEAMLRRDGRRTGLFTSPHLSRFTERIRVDGREADPAALAERYGRVMAVAPEGLTFFEQVTVLALLTFAEEATEALVLEVGLGGRLDATNVVDAEVAVITGVALDHEDVLGHDLEAIAREKAGIFKAGRVAIVGEGGEPQAVPLLEAEARARGADLRRAGRDVPEGWRIGLPGPHQAANAACALAAAEALGVPEAARRAGLEEARWRGRLEEIDGVLLDAAHNPQAARALAAALAGDPRPRVLLVAVSSDKDAAAILGPLVPGARAVVVTQAPVARARPAVELGALVPTALVEPDLERALALARELAAPGGGLVVAFGSIFLVGELRARLTGEPRDPVPLADPAAGPKLRVPETKA